ncbi:MAG TPA: dihydropyrimidine dehydrogenase, partial [Citreicella sp.]|nr:dihydropyrimidine dehydrogenase [Citreicella sp.]
TLRADSVLVGIGVIPETALAESLGLEIENGIVVDRFGRTGLDGVFAAGDIVRGASLVVWAIRDGRDCAEAVLKDFQSAAAIAAE